MENGPSTCRMAPRRSLPQLIDRLPLVCPSIEQYRLFYATKGGRVCVLFVCLACGGSLIVAQKMSRGLRTAPHYFALCIATTRRERRRNRRTSTHPDIMRLSAVRSSPRPWSAHIGRIDSSTRPKASDAPPHHHPQASHQQHHATRGGRQAVAGARVQPGRHDDVPAEPGA